MSNHNFQFFIGAYPAPSIKSTLTTVASAKQYIEENPAYFSSVQLGYSGAGTGTKTLKRF